MSVFIKAVIPVSGVPTHCDPLMQARQDSMGMALTGHGDPDDPLVQVGFSKDTTGHDDSLFPCQLVRLKDIMDMAQALWRAADPPEEDEDEQGAMRSVRDGGRTPDAARPYTGTLERQEVPRVWP